jgi:exosortase
LSDRSIGWNDGVADKLRDPLVWAVLAALALACILYYPLFFPESRQTVTAQSEDFFFEANEAAGGPVLLLTLWLFYRRSHYIDLLTQRGAPVLASLTIGMTLLVYGWGTYSQAVDLQLASIIGLLAGIVLLNGGQAAFRAYWVPIFFLIFALPISPVLLSAVLFPVQLATAQYAGIILNAIGVDSFVQGDQILRPENTFVVIETCSGMRTVVTLTMLTILLIDLFERRSWHAALLILLAPIVAFLTNGLRVVTLVLNPYSDVISIHNLQGIAMLLVGLTVIYLIDGAIERFLRRTDESDLDDDLEMVSNSGISNRAVAARVAAVCVVLVVMHAMTQWISPWPFKRYVEEPSGKLLERVFDGWPSEKLNPDYNFLGSVRFLSWEHRRVRVDGRPVDVFLGVADEQHRQQTILTPRLAWPASGYAVIDDEQRLLSSLGGSDAAGETNEVRRLVLRRGAKSVISYSWYARSGSLATEWFRQAAALDRSPFVRPRHILAVRISTTVGGQGSRVDDAEERIRRAYDRLAPELEDFAPTFASPAAAEAVERSVSDLPAERPQRVSLSPQARRNADAGQLRHST